LERHLTQEEKNQILDLYETRYRSMGRSYQTVGWSSIKDQFLRFEMLFRGLDPTGKTILDVGCGLGDLVIYLDKITGGNYHYIGIDLSLKLISDAQTAFGSENRKFIVGDILEMPDLKKVDIAVISGALSYRIEDNLSHAQTMIKRLFDLTTNTVSINFLTSYVDFQDKKNFHYSSEQMFTFARSVTKWVTLFHDYPLWEFTLQLNHTPFPQREK